ncbi:outer membrane protein assembly factor BamD [Marinoscillum furvescens]|uniref:Outer membrane protein assembly factor BamD (BamD/ComL family) n=1 Tax=Marinoscillum furvescens DSM 4134 TaxID=1122208 RepID=A0A3D9L794_MARFU|nr:WG repeat-containing protein [Marinoscillum furvescens]REE00591.1 outer membrane protein assembly factor BamD (BamD/ComL family) [Marinoscillum furvescens DSM 4134]
MSLRYYIIAFLIVISEVATAAGIFNRIQRAIDKNDLEKAEKLARKSLDKDPINPGAKFYLSVLFLQESYAKHNVDSARIYINEAIADFERVDPKTIDKLIKSDLFLSHFRDQKARVAQAGFEGAIQQMSVDAFKRFLTLYPEAKETGRATYLRDSLAYHNAQITNTWQSYKAYIDEYPESVFSSEAQDLYHKLLFRDKTNDDRLSSYVKFLEEHPNTPFRNEAEKVILYRSTILNRRADYLEFISSYPKSHMVRQAANHLYTLSTTKNEFAQVLGLHPQPDSLEHIWTLEQDTLLPVMNEGKFGFITLQAQQSIPFEYTTIDPSLICGNVQLPLLHVQKGNQWKVINRANLTVLEDVDRLQQITNDIYLVRHPNSAKLFHRGGWNLLSDQVEQAKPIANRWIAYQKGYKWGLVTPMGYILQTAEYDDILTVGPFILLEKDGRYAATTVDELGQERSPKLSFLYDDYEWIRPNKLQLFAGDHEALIDDELNELVPLAAHEIYVNDKFWYIKSDAGYQIIDEQNQDIVDQRFDYLEVNEGWMTFEKPDEWLLISRQSATILAMNGLDSARLLDRHAAYIQKSDTVQLVFQNRTTISLSENDEIRLINRKKEDRNSLAAYVMIQSDDESRIYDKNGNLSVRGTFDEVTLLRDSLFRVKRGNKAGLVTTNGEDILSADYDMLDEENGMVFLLRDGKIGCLDLDSGVFLPNQYETRIERFGTHYQIGLEGKTGIVNKANEEVLPAAYDELIAWGDSTCWARQESTWQLITYNQEVLVDEIQMVRVWFNSDGEQIALVRGPEGYGVFASLQGQLLEMQYNDIVNLGTQSTPIYFAEEHVKTADFFVVTYFDKSGAPIKSQAFRPEEYDLIYCDH